MSRRPSQSEIAAAYDRLHSEGLIVDTAYYHNTAVRLGALGGTVLDVGCGSGELMREVSRRSPGVSIIGVEISEVAALRARRHGEVVLGNGQSLPFKDAIFDFVLASTVIEHMSDPPSFVAEIARILKKDGRFLVTTDNRVWLRVMRLRNLVTPTRLRYREDMHLEQPIDRDFTFGELRALLEATSFKIVERRASGPLPFLNRFPLIAGVVGRLLPQLTKRIWIIAQKVG